jgi:hypothetical protein
MKLLRIFFWGLGISLLGSLPLGSLNVMAWRIYNDSNSLLNAAVFSLGVALVEVIYVRISLVAMKWVIRNKKLFRALEWFTIFLFIGLAIMSFVATAKTEEKAFYVSDNVWMQFLYGAGLCAINPVQIPFWFLWSTYLVSNKKLETRNDHYNFYCTGIGIGTLLGEAIYIFGGAFLVTQIGANQQQINYFVGAIFLVTALIQLYRVLGKKSKLESSELQEKLNEFPETIS